MIAALSCAGVSIAASCDSLASLTLPDTTITSAQMVAAGEFVAPPAPARGDGGGDFGQPGGRGTGPVGFKDLPAFCRVIATIKPTSDSEIKIEVWLPNSGPSAFRH